MNIKEQAGLIRDEKHRFTQIRVHDVSSYSGILSVTEAYSGIALTLAN
jgi:hypothetical protein